LTQPAADIVRRGKSAKLPSSGAQIFLVCDLPGQGESEGVETASAAVSGEGTATINALLGGCLGVCALGGLARV